MNCPKCGAEIPENASVCPRCAAPCHAEPFDSRSPWRMAALMLSLLAVACVGIVLLYYVVLRDLGSNVTAEFVPEDAVTGLTAAEETPAEVIELSPPQGQSTDSESSEQEVVLTLSATELRLQPGAQAGLSVSVQAPSGREVYVFWASSNDQVAEIDSSGMVTAVAEGDCILIASSGEVSAECHVTVETGASGSSYLLPSDTVLLTADDLEGLTREDVMLARNEIFARHGRVFQTVSIQTHFESCSWYTPNPDFDENAPGALTAMEQANLRFLIEYETSHGWR